MKNFLKILILPIVLSIMLGSFVDMAFAAVDPMTIIFENTPLFGEVNFLPGDSKDGDVTVTNNTDATQNVYAESVNGFDPDGLGSQLFLKVFENGNPNPIYQNEFNDFLSAGPVPLSSISSEATKLYTFKVSFIDSADNNYMGKSIGFDLCIGFSGGNFKCGDTIISDEEPVDENNPPGGGGGGGSQIPGGSGGSSSGQSVRLIIFNELVSGTTDGVPPPIINDGTAIIEWDTNLLATSQVIYGPVSGGPYTLDLSTSSLNLGYPFGTPENGTKVIHHIMALTGLVDGQTYVYRVVSRASPPTISTEHIFTMPTTGISGNSEIASTDFSGISRVDNVSNNSSTGQSEELDITDTNTNATATEAIEATDNSNLLAFALGGLNFSLSGFICIGVALIIFFILLGLIWLIFKDREVQSLARDITLLVIYGLVVSLILWFIPYTCPIIPFWIIVLIYIIWQLIFRNDQQD